jgi:hypothetical protein
VKAPNGRAALARRAVDDGEAVAVALTAGDGHERLVGRQVGLALGIDAHALHLGPRRGLIQVDADQAPRAEGRVLRDHLAARRTAGIHPLVIEDDPHVALGGPLDGESHEVDHPLAHPADGPGQPGARVDHEGVDAVRPEILYLAKQFLFGQVVVPEPERRLRELDGWIEPLGGHTHRDILRSQRRCKRQGESSRTGGSEKVTAVQFSGHRPILAEVNVAGAKDHSPLCTDAQFLCDLAELLDGKVQIVPRMGG